MFEKISKTKRQLTSLHYLPIMYYILAFYNGDSFVYGYNQDTPEQIMAYRTHTYGRVWLSSPSSLDIRRGWAILTSGDTGNSYALESYHFQRPVLNRNICN